MNRETRRSAIQLGAIGAVVAALVIVRTRPSEPFAFEGTLRYPMMNIGGEGSSAKLRTDHAVYDLFFDQGPNHALLDRLAGKRVRVIGKPLRAHGSERRGYPAIRVIELTPIPE